MGTKNNPGKYDCYHGAEPDEPIFTLKAKDKHAPTLVWLWAVLRELDGEKPEKVAEARQCVVAMIEWANVRGTKAVGLGESVLAGVLELIRAANQVVDRDVLGTPGNAKTENIRAFLAGLTGVEEKPT